jgi:SAM-dependent methyltransferase
MSAFSPTQWASRAQRAVQRLRVEGLGVIEDKYLQRRLPHEWSALASASHLFEDKVGVEIGGPSGIFRRGSAIPVYGLGLRVDNCNFSGDTAWVQAQRPGATFQFDEAKAPGNQFLCEGSALAAIADQSYDFVLSSHSIEHLANPLLGLTEWKRVLKPGGALLLVVPHKDGTFDHRRPVTSLSHLVLDHERQMPETDLTHLDEVLRLHDLTKDAGSGDFATFKSRCENNVVHRCIHHHVFNTHLVVELVDCVDLQIVHVQLLRPFHIVVLAQKLQHHATKNNAAFVGGDAAPVWQSPLPSDQRNYW